MRVLLTSVGTRGDVQPVLSLALEVRRLGHEVRLCIPPNFVADPELEAFLDRGEPPVCVGFGSMLTHADMGRALVDAARAVVGASSSRARGWARLAPIDAALDCITIDEVNHQALFARVATVVHHGGAGTTTTAARVGAPQVVIPMFSDQFYWVARVCELDAGTNVSSMPPEADALASALHRALEPAVVDRARAVASRVASHGAEVAARLLVAEGRS